MSKTQSYLARALAILLPVYVFVASARLILSPPPSLDKVTATELENAGRILNGTVYDHSAVRQMNLELQRARPRVLILGNSLAMTNIEPKVVARQLGLKPHKVVVFSVPNAVGSHLYAILENRVFDKGFDVELVIIMSSLRSLLIVEPYSEASRQNLLVQLDPEEPVLDRYIERERSWLETWDHQRLLWRQAGLDGLRNASVAATLGGNAEASMGRVFHYTNLEDLVPEGHSPIVDVRGAGDELAAVDLPTPGASLLPELARLANDNDAKLLVIRSPASPQTPPERSDWVPEGTSEATAALLADAGHRFLDMYGHEMPADQFENLRHMTLGGSYHFTHAIADDLRAAWEEARRPVE
ncbi:MAG TPA: hypothetical protein ENK18_15695 [Deltaproteobacteria bacterium]|nr:hypothetical protein [Deltaproteobacteria bacterium]